MYCPECSTQDLEAAKFCRVCGTNLEVVSLALVGNKAPAFRQDDAKPPVKTSDWLQKKAQSTRHVVQGGILLGVSLLIGLVGVIVDQAYDEAVKSNGKRPLNLETV